MSRRGSLIKGDDGKYRLVVIEVPKEDQPSLLDTIFVFEEMDKDPYEGSTNFSLDQLMDQLV